MLIKCVTIRVWLVLYICHVYLHMFTYYDVLTCTCTYTCSLINDVHIMQEGGIRFELQAAYLKLLSYLHLQHLIQTRLLLRGEFILPRSECTKPTRLFKPDGPHQSPSSLMRHAQSDGSHRQHSLSANILHNISNSFSEIECVCLFPLAGLREVVLNRLELLLSGDFYKMQLLPTNTVSNMFVPLIESLDTLLVIGALKDEADFQRLLCILDPLLFPTPSSSSEWFRGWSEAYTVLQCVTQYINTLVLWTDTILQHAVYIYLKQKQQQQIMSHNFFFLS